MKYIKTYENWGFPVEDRKFQINDYVWYQKNGTSGIFRICDIGKYAKNIKVVDVKLKGVKEFDFNHLGKNMFWVKSNEIDFISKNKNNLELYYNSKKYNL